MDATRSSGQKPCARTGTRGKNIRHLQLRLRWFAAESLGEKILVDSSHAPLTGVATLFVTTEGRVWCDIRAVDHHCPRPQLSCHRERALRVRGSYCVVQTVDGVVGNGDALLLRAVPH